jgi:thioredoxin-like negative regulator of GroEL
VENAPFLVTKLQVQVLPCVISFIDGISVDRVVGFEGLGGGKGVDNFKTQNLEARLLQCNVLVRSKLTGAESEFRASSQPQPSQTKQYEDDDDDDWD